MSSGHESSRAKISRKHSLKHKLNIKVVMLAEGIRPSPLDLQVGMPAPLLPIRGDLRLLDEWHRVLRGGGLADLPIDVVMASRAGFQSMESLANDDRYERTIEPRSHRGTAGVLADLLRGQFADNGFDYLVVIEGGSCPPLSIAGLAGAMHAGDDIILGTSEFDRYAGLVALKPDVLGVVPDKGFHDFKEQSLPAMLKEGRSISAVPIIPRAIRLRTLESWLESVRSTAISTPDPADGDSEGRVEGYCCISSTASIKGALIQNSVIMNGAVIEAGAIVARSAVLAGQRVAAHSSVIDSIVGVKGVYEVRGVS